MTAHESETQSNKHTTQQPEIIRKTFAAALRQVFADGAAEEEDKDNGRRDPERPVQVRVAL